MVQTEVVVLERCAGWEGDELEVPSDRTQLLLGEAGEHMVFMTPRWTKSRIQHRARPLARGERAIQRNLDRKVCHGCSFTLKFECGPLPQYPLMQDVR